MIERHRKVNIHASLDERDSDAFKALCAAMDQDGTKVVRLAITALLAHAAELGRDCTVPRLREAMMPAAAQGKLAIVGAKR